MENFNAIQYWSFNGRVDREKNFHQLKDAMLDATKQGDDNEAWDENSRNHAQADSSQVAFLIFYLKKLVPAKFWSKPV